MSLLGIIDFLGFMFIVIAAFLVSSKYVANPKVRVIVFSSYFIACFFLIIWGCMYGGKLITWFTLQQIILIFINIKGIRRARKDIRNSKACITCKFRENGYLCENDKVVCGDKYKGWKPRTK